MYSGDVTLLLGCEPFLSTAEGGKKNYWPSYSSRFYRWVNHPCVSGEWGSPPTPKLECTRVIYHSEVYESRGKKNVYFPQGKKKSHGLGNLCEAFHNEKVYKSHLCTTKNTIDAKGDSSDIFVINRKKLKKGTWKPPLKGLLHSWGVFFHVISFVNIFFELLFFIMNFTQNANITWRESAVLSFPERGRFFWAFRTTNKGINQSRCAEQVWVTPMFMKQ